MSLEILRIHALRKYYGPKLILDGIDMSLNHGERVALVGENGTGKTTLARMIIGEEEAASGSIHLVSGAKIGYLPQEVAGDDDTSVQAYIEGAMGQIDQLRQHMQDLEQQMMQSLSDQQMDDVLVAYGALQEQYERRGAYDLDSRMERIFSGLSIDYIDPQRPLDTLSGGERTRVALAALLLQSPDLLILDEPTNHLDFSGITWLENFLAEYNHALLLITHDRTFINRVANVICELNAVTRRLNTYHGNYEEYLEQREQAYQAQLEAYDARKNEMKALQRTIITQTHNTKGKVPPSVEPDKHIRFAKNEQSARTKSAKIRDARQRLATLEKDPLENPRHSWRIKFCFDPLPLPSREPIQLQGIQKAFGEQMVLGEVDATLYSGDRIVLLAPNGTGKTTLLRLIMGYETPDAGSITLSPSAYPGYLDQDGETLDPQQTVLECLREAMQGSDKKLLSELHRSGLFSDATLGQKTVHALSVGQRRKLGLARIIGSRANVLLLDEPTNHLDLISLEALESALLRFQGAMLAVSHDRRFIEKVATRIWQIKDGVLMEEARLS